MQVLERVRSVFSKGITTTNLRMLVMNVQRRSNNHLHSSTLEGLLGVGILQRRFLGRICMILKAFWFLFPSLQHTQLSIVYRISSIVSCFLYRQMGYGR